MMYAAIVGTLILRSADSARFTIGSIFELNLCAISSAAFFSSSLRIDANFRASSCEITSDMFFKISGAFFVEILKGIGYLLSMSRLLFPLFIILCLGYCIINIGHIKFFNAIAKVLSSETSLSHNPDFRSGCLGTTTRTGDLLFKVVSFLRKLIV